MQKGHISGHRKNFNQKKNRNWRCGWHSYRKNSLNHTSEKRFFFQFRILKWFYMQSLATANFSLVWPNFCTPYYTGENILSIQNRQHLLREKLEFTKIKKVARKLWKWICHVNRISKFWRAKYIPATVQDPNFSNIFFINITAGVYILQNTMVGGGGKKMADEGKK